METKKETHFLLKWYQNSVIIVALIALWFVLAHFMDSMYVPSPLKVLNEFGKLIASGELFKHIGTSLKIAFIGLLIGQVLAIPLGALLGWYSKAYRYLDPILTVLRNTSILAILPLFVLFLGIGDLPKIAIIAWGTFFPTFINTLQGVKTVDPILIRSAQSMGIGNLGLFFKVVLPAASPYITSGFRQAASVALLVIVGAEMIGARYGIGYMVFVAQKAYMVSKMYVGIITIAILGVVVNYLVERLERYVIRWQEKPSLS
ncbi:MAG: ABC transporter permease [Clostridiales Family XIII bacterium]|jgi:NitT/TauT family transport system permease protein|nr:ABC transporter permease [Clostridiales Family XIII bacterium]